MLTAKNIKPEQGKAYFEKGYLGSGRWFGDAARRLNLKQELKSQQEFENLMDGYSPDKSYSLMARRVKPSKHRSATDCTFNAPKSISLRALVDGDQRLIEAHQKAVEESLKVMESRYAQTRIQRKGEPRRKVCTKNLAIAQFDHIETRELDPHLHTHCVVINHTQGDDGKWRSLHNSDIFQNLKLLGMVYQHKLAREVEKLGYQVSLLGNGQFELVGYKQQDLDTFSQRKKQIIDKVGENATKREKIWAWNRTRRKKVLVKPEKLEFMWNQRAEQLKLQWEPSNLDNSKIQRAPSLSQLIADAVDNLSRSSLYLKLEDIEKYVLERSDAIELEEITKAVAPNKKLIKVDSNRYTTELGLRLEIGSIRLLQSQEKKKAVQPLFSDMYLRIKAQDKSLSQEQRKALTLTLTLTLSGTERFTAIRTTNFDQKYQTITALKYIAAERGFKLKAIATGDAAKLLREKVGIEPNSFEQLEAKVRANQIQIGKEIWLVAEAEKMSHIDCFNLMSAAVVTNTQVIMMGKVRERASQNNIFKSLQQSRMPRCFIEKPPIKDNVELEAAAELISKGEIKAGVSYLQRSGSITQVKPGKETEALVRDYLSLTPDQRNKTLILAGEEDRERIAFLIREQLKKKGKSATIEQVKRKTLTRTQDRLAYNYAVGDLIIPYFNSKKRNLQKQDVYLVVGKSRDDKDQLFVQNHGGKVHKIDLNFEKEVYSKNQLQITEGDRLRLTRQNQQKGYSKGSVFTVEEIRETSALIMFDDGKIDTIGLNNLQPVESVYCESKYPPRYRRADRVLMIAEGALQQDSLLNAIERTKKDLTIYVESPERLLDLTSLRRSHMNQVEMLKIQEMNRINEALTKTSQEDQQKSTNFQQPDIQLTP